MRHNHQLSEAYRAAWENYGVSSRELQHAADSGERDRLESLLLSVETARLEYNVARDRLAEEMVAGQ